MKADDGFVEDGKSYAIVGQETWKGLKAAGKLQGEAAEPAPISSWKWIPGSSPLI